jgi:hypothetical protein
LILRTLEPGQELPAAHPAAGKGLVAGRPSAYICVGPVCQAPVTEADQLDAALRVASHAAFA